MLEQIFVPDAPSSFHRKETVGTADDVELLRGEASAQVSSSPALERPTAESDQIPDWWNASPALHVSLYYKQEVCCSGVMLMAQAASLWMLGGSLHGISSSNGGLTPVLGDATGREDCQSDLEGDGRCKAGWE